MVHKTIRVDSSCETRHIIQNLRRVSIVISCSKLEY